MKAEKANWFDRYLELATAELEWEFGGIDLFAPADIDFLINPQRLRGSDFLMRWAQGRWSEEIVMRAINQTQQWSVVPYGPSTIAPDDPRELELFLEKMDVIAQEGKRPDLLLYDKRTFEWVQGQLVTQWGSVEKMAEMPSSQLGDVIRKARVALEIENSLWVTEKMPGFGKPFSRYRRGKNKGRLKPPGVVPTVIVKQEDIPRLQQWEADYSVPIYIVHIFYDRGYFIKFDAVLALLASGELGLETQRFTNPTGTATSTKQIVKVPYILCQEFGTVVGPTLEPKTFVDRNGKVMTFVTFSGGSINLSAAVFAEWSS